MSSIWMLVFSIALLLVVVGLIGLFAMMGELNASVGNHPGSQEERIAPIDEARIGYTPSTWPSALSAVQKATSGRLIIFSSICASCTEIASQLSTEGIDQADPAVAVISAIDSDAAQRFIVQTGLETSGIPLYVDPGGEWVGSELGIRIAPSIAVFHEGVLSSAASFADIAVLTHDRMRKRTRLNAYVVRSPELTSSPFRRTIGQGTASFVVTALLLGCSPQAEAPGPSRVPSSSGAATTTTVAGCEVSPYQTSELPAPFQQYVKGPGLWMGDSGAVAVLFYTEADPANIEIGTHGVQGPGMNSKILWLVADSPSGPLTLLARNRDTGSEVTMQVEGAGNYPSTPDLPEPGCWEISAQIGGEVLLRITLPAVDRG